MLSEVVRTPFTVLLKSREGIEDFGENALLKHVMAFDVTDAIRRARHQAAGDTHAQVEPCRPMDFHVLLVCEEHIADMKEQAITSEVAYDILRRLRLDRKS